MDFIDESKKLVNYKNLKYSPIKNIQKIYEVKKGDNVLIWCDLGFPSHRASPCMGKTFYNYFKKIGCNVSIIVGKANKKPQLARADINLAVLALSKGDLFVSLGSTQAIYFHKNKKRLITRKLIDEIGFKMVATNGLISLSEKNISKFFNAFNHNEKEIKNLNLKIIKTLKKTNNVYITCPLGTSISFNLEKNRKPISNYGDWRDYSTNYPVGEAYVAPKEWTANGVAFVKSSKVLGETIINKKPAKYFFKNGVLIDSSLKKLNNGLKELEKFNKKQGIKNSYSAVRNFAEFAIGTNKKASVIGVMICDEKAYGTCHFGLGANIHFGGKIECNGHSDHVIENPSIWFDGKLIMDKGKLLL
jgi:hypothetical protein